MTVDGRESVVLWRHYSDAADYDAITYPYQPTPREQIDAVVNALDDDLEDANYHGLIGKAKVLADILLKVTGTEYIVAEYVTAVYEQGGLLPYYRD